MRVLCTAGYWVGWLAGLLGFYLLLAVKLSWQEAAAGAVAAAVGATGATVVARVGGLHFRVHLRWLRRFIRLPWRVLADCGIVTAALGCALVRRRPVEGYFRTVPFDPGDNRGDSAARRALVAAGISIAPNTFVVAIDREHHLLVIHQLVPSARPPRGEDEEWPQ